MVLVCFCAGHITLFVELGMEGLYICMLITIYYGINVTLLLIKNEITVDPIDFWKPLRGNDMGEKGDQIKKYYKLSSISCAVATAILIVMMFGYAVLRNQCL